MYMRKGNTACPNQISNCAALCKGQVSANTCTSNNDGVDNPFRSITYCFECACADGSTPDLAQYLDTIPTMVCQRRLQNCQYGYNQVGQSAPDGACTKCGSTYAVEPSWYSLLSSMRRTTTTTSSEAAPATTTPTEATTSPAEVEVTTTSSEETSSTSSLLTSTSTSSSTSASETTTSSTTSSSQGSSAPAITSQSTATVRTSTTTSSTRSSTSSTTSAAPVKSAGAAMVEPAMAVFGMGLAAVMVL